MSMIAKFIRSQLTETEDARGLDLAAVQMTSATKQS